MLDTATPIDPNEIQSFDLAVRTFQSTREWSAMPDQDRADIEAFVNEVRGVVASVTESTHRVTATGQYTEQGIAALVANETQPRRGQALKALGAFETRTVVRDEGLATARTLIERGELVRDEQGKFVPVRRSEPTARSEVRAGELRTWLRGLPAGERDELIIQAFESENGELLDAIAGANAAMAVMGPLASQIIRDRRLTRAGWAATEERDSTVVSMRHAIAARARAVLRVPTD